MLAELRAKSQITLPKDIVKKLGLSEGDKLEITEQNGVISIVPVTVYPKRYLDDLHAEILQVKEDIRYGKQPVFDNIDALIDKLAED